MRIFIHDYAGHPFAFELSRELAKRGHVVRHAYFGGDQGPKGMAQILPSDPEAFSIEAIDLGKRYTKLDLVRRHLLDGHYGKLAARSLAAFRPDIALVANTPVNALGVMQRAARSCNSKFILWLQDLYGPASATLLRNRWAGAGRLAAMAYQALERSVILRSDGIVAISEDFEPYLARVGCRNGAVSVIPNWGALSVISPRPKGNAWSREYGTEKKLAFIYTGTLGLKHNPQLLYDLAQFFSKTPGVVVQVAASGVGAAWLREKVVTNPLPNLDVLPVAPMERLSDVYGSADVLLGILDAEAGQFSAPSKVLGYLCASRPILLSAPSGNSSARTLLAAGGGLVTPAGSSSAFLGAANQLVQSAPQRASMGAAGFSYAKSAFDIVEIAHKFEALV